MPGAVQPWVWLLMGLGFFGHMVLWVGLCPCRTVPVVPTASWQQGMVITRLMGLEGLWCPSLDVPRGTHGPGEVELPLG